MTTDEKFVQILNTTFKSDGRDKGPGDHISLPIEDADRYIKLGLVCELDRAPGYQDIEGQTWVKISIRATLAGRDNDVFPGEVVALEDQVAAELIKNGHAEKYGDIKSGVNHE